MKNKLVLFFLTGFAVLELCFTFTSCFDEKNSPLYDSEWAFINKDLEGKTYINQLFLNPDHTVTIQEHYDGYDDFIVWTGKYKLTDKKIEFDIDKCMQYSKGVAVAQINTVRIIKYFAGEFLYSVGEVEVKNNETEWQLALIRPKNFFYGQNLDFLGNNPLETYVRQPKK